MNRVNVSTADQVFTLKVENVCHVTRPVHFVTKKHVLNVRLGGSGPREQNANSVKKERKYLIQRLEDALHKRSWIIHFGFLLKMQKNASLSYLNGGLIKNQNKYQSMKILE